MPVLLNSRYYGLSTYEATDAKGETHPTVAIRLHSPPGPDAGIAQHRLVGAETLEYLAWRQYGSSAAWWRIADAGPPVFPLDVQPGDVVNLPSAIHVGRVERPRRF